MNGRVLILLAAAAALAADASYQDEIAQWRRSRETSLRANWLQVAGLFWLHDGANRFGTDPSNDVVLPDGPARAGTFDLRNGKVSVNMPGASRVLTADNSSDVVKVGRLTMFVIDRGGRFGIRMKDPQSAYLRAFHGLEYFPLKEEYRVTARFVSQPKTIPILNVLGQTEPSNCPGYAVFRLRGKEYRLYPILEQPDAKQLFFILRDETAGKETYPAGRFLYSDLPKDSRVVLDFNKAYNPPCAFTDYATCPLPPRENRLAVRIEAGEKRYGH